VFLDKDVSRAWLPETHLRPYRGRQKTKLTAEVYVHADSLTLSLLLAEVFTAQPSMADKNYYYYYYYKSKDLSGTITSQTLQGHFTKLRKMLDNKVVAVPVCRAF